MRHWRYRDIKLKEKLFLTYFGIFMLFFLVVSYVVFNSTTAIINKSIEKQLMDQADRIKDSVDIAADTSIRNHLRTIAETNLELCQFYYQRAQRGIITEKEAQETVKQLFSSQKIGKSGYIYVVNSQGILQHHSQSSLLGTDISNYNFVKEQIRLKNGYIEYDWKNPDEQTERPKSLYMSYFKPWDWIISASSYREEFAQLINIQDFKLKILAIKFGESGYITVLDEQGRFLIHPSYEGRNLFEENHPQGDIVYKFITGKAGYYEYDWQNANESKPRMKISVVSEIPEYQWLVAATSYKDDFYRDIDQIKSFLFYLALIGLCLLLAITYLLSSSITKPLRSIERTILRGASGDLGARVHMDQKDEIGKIGRAFNQFLESLQTKEEEIRTEISERRQAEIKLEQLNEHLEELVEARTDALNQSLESLKLAQADLIRSEKYLALGAMVSNIGHHLNTPLGNALTTSSFIINLLNKFDEAYQNKKLSSSGLESFVAEMNDAVHLLIHCLNHSIELVETFKLLKTRDLKLPIEQFELTDIFQKINTEFQQLHEHRNIHFQLTCPESIHMEGYKEIYEMILSQLLSNAAIHGLSDLSGGTVTTSVAVNDAQLHLTVTDTGKGIPAERLAHIFEPFYASDGTMGSNTLGLGLNLVYKSIVEVLNGTIVIESSESIGTKVIITIPVNEENL